MESRQPAETANIGRSILRNEDPLFLTGKATYVADLRHPLLRQAAHVVFVRSEFAFARIVSIDVAEALEAPGVVSVVVGDSQTPKPVGPYLPALDDRFAQPLLADSQVRYVGEPMAVVIADTYEQAVDAAELVVVNYEILEPVMTVTEARLMEPNLVLTAADSGSKTEHDRVKFETAEVLIKHRFVNPRQMAAPIECRGGAAAWVEDDHVHLWTSTQRPHKIRDLVAAIYGLSLANVHSTAGPFVGGGFGGKGAPGPEEQLLPYLARVARRPVRWNETRTEHLTGAVQGRGEEVDVWLAGTTDGHFDAVRVEIVKDAGAYPSAGASLPSIYSRPMVTGTYNIAHAEFDSITVTTNRPPVAALRGAGRAPVLAALERAVDMYASRIGFDPAELRRRNLISPEQMPFTTPTDGVYDEADYPSALEAVLANVGYEKLRAEQTSRRDNKEAKALGIGVSSYNHKTVGGGTEEAVVKVNVDGSATVITGTTSQGHGHAITWAQIASDELGIALDQINVVEGVTDEIATGQGAIGSRSLQVAGMAIHRAAQQVVEAARNLAAEMIEAAPGDIVLDRSVGAFHVAGTPTTAVGWAELATHELSQNRELGCDFVYDPGGQDTFPSGAHVAVVEVDTETGSWSLIKYCAVDDAGVRVNPMIVDGQLHGGIALGVAQVLGEEVVHDQMGNPLTSTFLDYPIASIDQFCQFEIQAQTVPTSFNSQGYKAVGESGPVGATPAVHNAVMDAVGHLGVDHIDIPVTPEKLWRAINF